ncbi:chemotaxis protein histidine kinase CheA [Mycobacteroides chelonae]|nr:chemotaxis protein histidine kinase CheA [Mycobacteroides chelonae]
MSESDDTQRPVSVAELLARNGAAEGKISGHRRRMRGNADAIPVAELTGEIPVIRDRKGGRARPNPAPSTAPEATTPPPKASEAAAPQEARSYLRSNEDALFGGDSMADEAARRGTTTAQPPAPAQPSSMASSLRSIFPPTPTPVARPGEPRKSIDFNDATGVISPVTNEPTPEPTPEPAASATAPPAAAVSRPEPVKQPEPESEPEPEPVAVVQPEPEPESHEDTHAQTADHTERDEAEYDEAEYDEAEYEEDHEYAQFAHGSAVEWASHDAEQDVEDDEFEDREDDYQLEHELQDLVNEHGGPAEPEASQFAAVDTDKESESETAEAKADRREKIKTYLQGSWIAAQYLLAAAAGAGLFFVFRELWSWNQGFALLLGVLFIAILVASLWVIRKTVDLASILIAIVVGALIAFGPLVLMLQAVD